MDNSQSSDVFSEKKSDYDNVSPENINFESYNIILKKINNVFQSNLRNKKLTDITLSSILTDCQCCVTQALEIVVSLLRDTNFNVDKLCGYLEDTINILQMLSDFIKNTIETVVMFCCNLKSFPTTTANIILIVYMHCRDSECLYGTHLKLAEKQLKDLFRSCHELQLTYLMTFEKYFLFDLTEREQQEILIEALNINIKIGEIVQMLDIKAMADQWKACTVICEKYSNFLLIDNNIYNKCTKLFATIIRENIKTAIEADQGDKNVLRSLKVANFTIKLLLRICSIFKNAMTSNNDHIIEILLYIYLHNTAYLKTLEQKSEQFFNLVHTNIFQPTDRLLLELSVNQCFLDNVSNIDVKKLDTENLLGYIILTISMMRVLLHQTLHEAKLKIISCVFKMVPFGHTWFNMQLNFYDKINNEDSKKRFSLFENLLIHTVAFSSTFNSEQYAVLEKQIYEAVLSTECYGALFSSNLWVLLVRFSRSNRLMLNTLTFLLKAYQRLEMQKSFHNSPQKVHISYTIRMFYKTLSTTDKSLIYKQFDLQCNDYIGLWSALGVCNLPENLRRYAEDMILDKVKKSYKNCFGLMSTPITEDGKKDMINITRLAATSPFFGNDSTIKEYLINAWDKACLDKKVILSKDDCITWTEWDLEYLKSLVSLTKSFEFELWSYSNVGKLIQNISTILRISNVEEIIILFELFCSFIFKRIRDENKNIVMESLFCDILKKVIRDAEPFLRLHIFRNMIKYGNCKEMDKLIFNVIREDDFLYKEWKMHCESLNYPNSLEWKQQLIQAENYVFRHKCTQTNANKQIKDLSMENTQANFDLGDSLFDDDSGSEEPTSKKVKVDPCETEALIARLENNALLLCKLKENLSDEYKKRIRDVCKKIQNTVS